MNKKHQTESQQNIESPRTSFKVSAKRTTESLQRLSQGDIFKDIEVMEDFLVDKAIITTQQISFPFVVCLNQECDLENDFSNRAVLSDNTLLHLAVAPAFIFDQFLNGTHWGGIFNNNKPQKRTDTTIKKIIDNEIPRYHYLKFPDSDMPELIIDFKHFFSVNEKMLYGQMNKRLCSLDYLFREKINQRFSYYISRIGLPE